MASDFPFAHLGDDGSMASELPSEYLDDGSFQYYGQGVAKNISKAVIHPKCDSIENGAFRECSSLESIEIPPSVKLIGPSAFQGCSSLRSIDISSVSVVAESAFYECSSLISVDVSSIVDNVYLETFAKCASLESIQLPSEIEYIGPSAFAGCISLKSLVMPTSMTEICENAFYLCSSLESIHIPPGVTRIGDGAFMGCSSLRSIDIPASVETIGKNVFRQCPQIESKATVYQTTSEGWVTRYMTHLPLHQVCYKKDVTLDEISLCLASHPEAVSTEDVFARTPLSLLVMNPKVEPDMVQALLDTYPEAAMRKGPMGMTPLHLACRNQAVPLSVIEKLSNTSIMDPDLQLPVIKVPNDKNDVPCVVAIRNDMPKEICHHLFALAPLTISEIRLKKSQVMALNNEKDEARFLWGVFASHYIETLLSMKKGDLQALNPVQQHGFVRFVSSIDDEGISQDLASAIQDANPSVIKVLASFKDPQGRSALDSAARHVRNAIQEAILFLGRYDLAKGPPLHKSATSILIKAIDFKAEDEYRDKFRQVLRDGQESVGKYELRAVLDTLGIGVDEESFKEKFKRWDMDDDEQISEDEFVEIYKTEFDHGRPRGVVLKFMKNKDQFQREVDSRHRYNLDSMYVVGIIQRFSKDNDKDFRKAIASIGGEIPGIRHYHYAIVMPSADRNLDTIFRSERPNPLRIRAFAKDLADAIAHVHSKGLVHGDIKLLNVVRFSGRLRLIDLDSTVKLGSPVGVKFSSGILPPEMIAHLSVKECREFLSYFERTKKDDFANWEKLSSKLPFVVKTFRTKAGWEVTFERGEEVKRQVAVPEDVDGLPYDLVDANQAIDIWSFGTVLYSLYTGSSLFDVNRDDDMKTSDSIRELHDWDNVVKRTKLNHVRDPLARSLLNKVLSRNPKERYSSMHEVLLDDYFVANSAPGRVDDLKKELLGEISVMLENMKDSIMKRIKVSTTVTCRAVFEATEVNTPTCFVILPNKIVLPQRDSDEKKDTCSRFTETARYIQDVLDRTTSCIGSPLAFASEYIKGHFIEETMWFYLIDEYTGEPVCVEGVYPVEIRVRSELAKQFLPVMSLGMQALSITNGAAGLVNMFYPAFPGPIIPLNLIESANKFIEESNKCGLVPQVADGGSGSSVTVRGPELRELVAFLEEKDPERTYCGLRRVGDDSGHAIWVTKESELLMKAENESDSTATEQIVQLKQQLKEIESANEKMENDLAQKEHFIHNLQTANKAVEEDLAKVQEEDALKAETIQTLLAANANSTNECCCATM